MWYVYVLENISNKRLYIGYTNDLKRRFAEHNQGRGGAYTKKMGEFKLIFYETYMEKSDAAKGEVFYKSGYGREVLKGKLSNYLKI